MIMLIGLLLALTLLTAWIVIKGEDDEDSERD